MRPTMESVGEMEKPVDLLWLSSWSGRTGRPRRLLPSHPSFGPLGGGGFSRGPIVDRKKGDDPIPGP